MTDRSILPDDDGFDETKPMADFDRFMRRMTIAAIGGVLLVIGCIAHACASGRWG